MPAGGLGDVTRGDLDQPRNGAADQPGEPYPHHPETSPSEPALANDHVLREESAADSTEGNHAGSQPGPRNPGDPGAAGDVRGNEPPDHMQRAVDAAASIAEETGGLGGSAVR